MPPPKNTASEGLDGRIAATQNALNLVMPYF
jgi:hypothetical protein